MITPPPATITGNFPDLSASAAASSEAGPPAERSILTGLGSVTSISP